MTDSLLQHETSEPPSDGAFLIFPPFADPTWPYVSLPTLKGYLAKRGIGVTVKDFNIEGLHFLLAGETMAEWRQRLTDRFRELNRTGRLTLYEQMEYRRVAEALSLCRDFSECLSVMRDPNKFYNKKSYLRSRDGFEELFLVMEAVFFPFRFGFNRAAHLVAPWDFDLLSHYVSEKCSPFDRFYRRRLNDLADARFIGISLTFISQIPEAFYLCRMLRQRFPDCFLMLGGPCIDQMIRHSDRKTMDRLFDDVDAVGMQEGERTLAELLPLLNSGNRATERLGAIPNLMMRGPVPGTFVAVPSVPLDLADTETPDYSDLPPDRYLAPEPMLLYSPTRGCYWNKCSFCCYGFNQSGRHDYREIPVNRAVADLTAMQKAYGANNFYLSADVLSPDYAVALARRILDEGLDIWWSTDLRIELFYTPERCRLLHRAGLRAVAFGVESGCDRVLRLMNKGTNTKLIRRINRNFHEAGIATSWMTFLGHPGETTEEAHQTLDLLHRERDVVDQFITGDFNLTPGSLICCHPEKYGIDSVYFTAGDVFRLFPLFRLTENGCSSPDEAALESKIDALSRRYHLDHYPWAGAISTHHSFLHLLRTGQRTFARPWQRFVKKPSRRHQSPSFRLKHSLETCRRREASFLNRYLEEALRPGENTRPAPLGFVHFRNAIREK